MTDVATTHPISTATAKALERELFGHVIDGETVPSLDGATMPVIDPATGEQIATAASGSAQDVARAVRSARAAFDDGRWRHLPPHEKERRLHRLADLLADRGELFGELDVLDAGLLRWYTELHRRVRRRRHRVLRGLAHRSSRARSRATPPEFAVSEVREPVGVVGLITPWNGPTVRVRLRRRRAGHGQLASSSSRRSRRRWPRC